MDPASLDGIAEAFRASIRNLEPIAERSGTYVAAPVRARTYVADFSLPQALVKSVRAVVFRRRAVVVVRERDGYRHITPGGRLEAGETCEQALRREVLEECGWSLGPIGPLGFEHVQHVGEPPGGFSRAGFINPIYLAEGVAFDRSARDMSQNEAGSSLVAISRAPWHLPDWSRALLGAAVLARP